MDAKKGFSLRIPQNINIDKPFLICLDGDQEKLEFDYYTWIELGGHSSLSVIILEESVKASQKTKIIQFEIH